MKKFDLGHMGFSKKKDNDPKDAQEQEDEEVDASEFEEEDVLPVKVKNRRPKEDNFTQQHLKAWNPVYTPRVVIPIYLLIAIVFVIVGGCLLAEANTVSELTIWYDECATEAPTGSNSWSDMPQKYWYQSYRRHKNYKTSPQWRYSDDPTDDSSEKGTCHIRFTTPESFKKTVFVNYMLENFSANHRRYVLSFSEDQIRGKDASYTDIHDGAGINCKILSRNSEGKLYYPCGLIANSLFNDTFPDELINVTDTSRNYPLTNKNINWKSDRTRFKKTTYNHTKIAPPPYWLKKFPDGYNETNVPDINDWEEFQNWMRPAAFDKFAKLIRKNSDDDLPAGEYQIDIGLHWPVRQFNGKKGVYITHGSSIGSRNYFLGTVYLIGGCLCAAFALVFLLFWLISGRKVADTRYLSWNQTSVTM
ncbi:probable Alkylphosphocholine resistance protein LEM3 [Zygosaccharomyces bailii]|nr:probable Alkylphosphocholine resistance protein LEM3 [Zygosaccharomyces bailii]